MSTITTDVPLDVLQLIAQYLDVPSFLAFSSTCRALSDPELSLDPLYWRNAVRTTFRVPNQPVAESDGQRWQKLYKRLRTQTKPYTWGDNKKGNLGHSYLTADELDALPPAERMRVARRSRQSSWPEEMEGYQQAGVIADMQAGGWSTTFLTSKGALYCTGVLDGMRFSGRPPRMQAVHRRPEKLHYPRGYVHPTQRYDPESAIKQFSSGRAHVLGLSDAGRIWSWGDIEEDGLSVKLLNVDLNKGGNPSGKSKVKKVVAGFNKSAALVKGTGIVVWDPVTRAGDQTSHEDTVLVLDTATVPQTSFERATIGHRKSDANSGAPHEDIGEVLDFILLEECVVFNTHHGRAFASWINWTDDEKSAGNIVEILPQLAPAEMDEPIELNKETSFVTDVQGTFRNFALFTRSGEVLTATQDLIRQRIDDPHAREPTQFLKMPALQNTGVIALAFGDHHFLALHSEGHITSYGTESQACGSLGLGGRRDPEGRLRGIRYAGMAGDGKLVTHAYTTGRRVWFEPEKREWIKFLISGGPDPPEAMERIRMCADPNVQAEVSEWIEQEGNAWEERFGRSPVSQDTSSGASISSFRTASEGKEDNLAPYFALSVTAAGWHSGALVLVNEAVATRIRNNAIINTPLPGAEKTTPEQQPTRTTQDQQGNFVSSALTSAANNIGWLLGLSSSQQQSPAPQNQGFEEQGREVFANPHIRFPPHRPIPSRQGADPPEENVWDPNDDPARAQPQRPPGRQQQMPASQEGAQLRPGRPVRHFDEPVNHGAAPDANSHWAWAYDPFPRLELSNGRIMPGEVEISQWRHGRPQWDLEFTAYS